MQVVRIVYSVATLVDAPCKPSSSRSDMLGLIMDAYKDGYGIRAYVEEKQSDVDVIVVLFFRL